MNIKLRFIRERNRLYKNTLKFLWYLQGRDSARVYMFHSVLDSKADVYSKFAISTASFEKFLEFELSRGQLPMTEADLKKAVVRPEEFNNRFAVSFDDIYDSVFTNAYPVLKRLNIPFIIFVTPGLIDKIDPATKYPHITKEHLEELMEDELCIVGSHGMAHKPFRYYSESEAIRSMEDSKIILNRKTDIFAFPYGRRVEVSDRNIACAQKSGYCCAFSALDGSLKQKWLSGRWFLPRILVGEDYVKRQVK